MSSSQFLLFHARDRLCGLPLAHAVETMRPLPVQGFPGMPASVLGLTIVRGSAIPVVDAGALFDGSGPSAFGRFVVLRAGTRRIVLATEDVVGAREVSAGSLAELPPLLGSARGEVVDALGTLDGELLLLLRAGRILSASAWAAVDAGGDAT